VTFAGLLLFLVVAGVLLWMFPLEETIKKIILGLVVIVAVIWLFAALGWVSVPNLFRGVQ